MEQDELKSVDDVAPVEEGGPIARSGFNYQDELGVGFLLDMVEDSGIVKIHFETHDDIVLVRLAGSTTVAEFIQVKGGQINRLWSVADLCARDKGEGSSILEKSLARDEHREESRFRIVTSRAIKNELKPLSFPPGAPGRQADNPGMVALLKALQKRCPDC